MFKKLFPHKLANNFLLAYLVVTAIWLFISGAWLFPGHTPAETWNETGIKASYLCSLGFLWHRILSWLLIRRDKAETLANERLKMYQNVVHNSPLGMHHYHLDGDKLIFVGANPAADAMLGIDHQKLMGMTLEEAFPGYRSEPKSPIPQMYKDIAKGKLPLQVKRTEYHDDVNHIDGIYDIYAFQISQDMCTVKFLDVTKEVEIAKAFERAVNTVKTVAALLLRAEALAKIGSWNLDVKTGIMTASRGAFNIYGMNVNEEMGEISLELVQSHRLPGAEEASDKALSDLITKGVPYDLRAKIRQGLSGKIIDIHSVAEFDSISGIIHGMLQDVTKEVQAEEQLHQTIKEKEILLQEVHHRVKNNLQITISLLNLQMEKFEDPETVIAFTEAVSRLQVMALSHQSLYKSKDFSKLDIPMFFREIADAVSYIWAEKVPTPIRYNLEEISLTLDKAIPCGLILNELLTNALKHAFPLGIERKPEIFISSRILGESIEVVLEDNGIGINTISTASGLGTSLIDSLTQQLHGTIEYQRKDTGTKVILIIPADKIEK